MIELAAKLKNVLPTNNHLFKVLATWPGKVFSEDRGRVTKQITIDNQPYFVKCHHGIGWREIFKNLFQGKIPILSAKTEYLAIQRCHEIHVDTMTIVGFGLQGLNPAQQKSFLLTDALLQTESLENLCRDWKNNKPDFKFKKQLIIQLATLLRQFHQAGMNHRDCYLCHFRLQLTAEGKLPESHAIKLYVMDLHRCQIRTKVPARWLIKDLGSLLFSTRDIGLTRGDLLRFTRCYENLSLRKALATPVWCAVQQRCQQLIDKHT